MIDDKHLPEGGDFRLAEREPPVIVPVGLHVPEQAAKMIAACPNLAASVAISTLANGVTTPMAVSALFFSDAALSAERTEDERVEFINAVVAGAVRTLAGIFGKEIATQALLTALAEDLLESISKRAPDPKAN